MHRDVSPGNIIIYKGHAKLSDFEFTKMYEGDTSNNIRVVSRPLTKYLVFLFDFYVVGHLRFYGGRSGNWRIYEPG